MQPMTIPEIISAVDGTWLNPRKGAAPVTAVCTDSRKIAPGCLFLPWVGERFDGHDFIDRALDAGAAGCLCARRPELLRPDKFYIQVADTRLALRALASAYRDRFAIPFVQVTGSVGKTTTKEMLAAVLGAKLRVLKTPENFNNDIGTPLTLLGLGPEHQAAVIETGMNHFGEIRYLGEMVRPDIAVISNIGDAHIEHLGSREGILKAKSEIFENLKPEGLAVLNGDDALLRPLSGTWYWLAIRGALFLLPLAVCLVLALVFRKKLAARRVRDPIDLKWRRLFFRTPGWIIFLVLSCVCIILNFFVLGA